MFIFAQKFFKEKYKEITAFNEVDFKKAIEEIEFLKENYYLAGYISYQAKDVFLNRKISSKTPLLYFAAYKKYEHYNPKTNAKEAQLYIKENIDFKKYSATIKKIKKYIENGTTYELNYTFSNDVFSYLDGLELYLSLLKNQKTKYNSYINNKYSEILSFSPELFFEIKDKKIITKPMKGTVRRSGKDREEIDFLRNDIKNIAENTMIVDLLRNDLSKINNSSNIIVEKLFKIETHKTLHQMTSTISANIEKIDLYNILSCIFPCGSITGAPKISTMEIIDKIENYKRNIYCGLIGYIYKDSACFSVPIRILEKTKKIKENKYIFSQGGAIVYKSNTKDEWEECKTKKLFLNPSLDFDLIETILIENNTPFLYFEHLKRLKKTAKYFGFKFSEKLENETFQNNKIARIILKKDGSYKIEHHEIKSIKTNKVLLSNIKANSKNPFLYHKTTFCPWYDKARKLIKNNEIFDMIFFNEKDELTEGARTNIILSKDNILYTPKQTSGLLNGVFRQSLIKNNKIIEKKLYYDDLKKAQKIYLINSVRKMKEITFEDIVP